MALFKKATEPSIPPGQHVTDGFPVLHVGDVPAFDRAAWRLRIFGSCRNAFELTYDELIALPAAQWNGDIHCVTRWSKRNTHWKGVLFRDIASRAAVSSTATHVLQHADNAYTTNLPLQVMFGDDCLVAYEFEGAPLEPVHGGPVRMLVPSRYFWKSAKWLRGIEFLNEDHPGFWEMRGYHNDGDPWKEERYADAPGWFG